MSGVGGIGGAAGIDRVLALRAQILERNEALARAAQTGPASTAAAPAQAGATSFADTLGDALKSVNRAQNDSSAAWDWPSSPRSWSSRSSADGCICSPARAAIWSPAS